MRARKNNPLRRTPIPPPALPGSGVGDRRAARNELTQNSRQRPLSFLSKLSLASASCRRQPGDVKLEVASKASGARDISTLRAGGPLKKSRVDPLLHRAIMPDNGGTLPPQGRLSYHHFHDDRHEPRPTFPASADRGRACGVERLDPRRTDCPVSGLSFAPGLRPRE